MMKLWGMYPTSETIFLQTKEVERNHNAPDYTYTGNREKQYVTLELS
jgi:hypothetical protein